MKYINVFIIDCYQSSLSSGERELKFNNISEELKKVSSLSSGERELKSYIVSIFLITNKSLSSGERELKLK